MDGKLRRGEMKAISGSRFPRGLGHDFAGVVEAVGPRVKRRKVGEEGFGVTSIRQAGAFAEYVVTDEKNVALKPRSFSFEQAAAFTIGRRFETLATALSTNASLTVEPERWRGPRQTLARKRGPTQKSFADTKRQKTTADRVAIL
jgi:NADPH:quinone reductase-like Zn-dependent oxidoreductase